MSIILRAVRRHLGTPKMNLIGCETAAAAADGCMEPKHVMEEEQEI
jgi:hypothetical protein